MTISTSHPARWHVPTPHLDYQRLWNSVRRLGRLSNRLGIDLGTSKTSIYSPEQGVVLQEPSVVAINKETLKPIAFGTAAKELIGRNPEEIAVIRPIRNGVVTEFELTEQMLQRFMRQAQGGHPVFRPQVAAACAHGVTSIERLALTEVMSEAGARKVSLIDKSIAAAIGAGLPIDHPTGNLIVDVGGGTTEVAIVGQMGTVINVTSWEAGEAIDQAIQYFLKSRHHLLIGELMAENIKIKYGSAFANPQQDNQESNISGLDPVSGLCRSVTICRGDLREAISKPLHSIVDTVKRILELTPPELISDIADRGVILTGGGALLTGLDQLISHEVNLFVQMASDPLNGVAMGAGYTLETPVPHSKILVAQ
ncbi:Rod shape-determining protein MreB [Acaryochloris thomasi RCC1774]|uniref:Cell shape-determining protein MreB n=1 Tax=Acaryochloris thomasi RCC1774 TaxID=1764569 RepID=A0A2W1JAJ2_9CYAN|nr:rod shape-determining protein [Acaryochloris thomasi]PZD71169.1 Rod shape-determining protein MreB [Acaryochloris thomasi RCC1774]